MLYLFDDYIHKIQLLIYNRIRKFVHVPLYDLLIDKWWHGGCCILIISMTLDKMEIHINPNQYIMYICVFCI